MSVKDAVSLRSLHAAWREARRGKKPSHNHLRFETFLADRLRLKLKADTKLQPLTDGIDFLGYVIYPTHQVVRQRVVDHVTQKLTDWQQRHVRRDRIRATPEDFRQIRSTWNSYAGHFSHASAYRLQQRLRRRFPWLNAATAGRSFDHRLEGRTLSLRHHS